MLLHQNIVGTMFWGHPVGNENISCYVYLVKYVTEGMFVV